MRNYLLIFFVVSFLGISVAAQQHKESGDKSLVFQGVIKNTVYEDERNTQKQFLDTGNKLIPIFLDGGKFLNTKVSIEGRLNKVGVIIPGKIQILEAPNKTLDIPVMGTRTVLVLPVNFPNATSQPVTPEELRSLIFTGANSVNTYFQQVSYGQLSLVGRQNVNGDIASWRTLSLDDFMCYGRISQYINEADSFAIQQGYNPNLYQSIIYVFPRTNACSFGQGSIGTIGNQSQVNRIWVSVDSFTTSYNYYHHRFSNLLGSNLGLEYSSAYRNCPTETPFENCQGREYYGDNSCVMGNVSYFTPPMTRLLNNYQRLRLGWLNGKIKTFDSPGTYYVRLLSPSHPTKGTTLAQIRLKDTNGNFTGKSIYLEFKRNSPPADIFDSTEFFNRGVAIRFARDHTYPFPTTSYLIDTTPETGQPNYTDFRDAPLTPGRTFTNSYYGISITPESVNPFLGARVKIELSR